MKKLILSSILLAFAGFAAGCSSDSSETVKIGISGTDTRTWDFIAEKAEKEGIDIEIVSFSDYVAPNTALAENELDLNAFQTVAYFDVFIEEHNLDLVPIATTVLAPMGIYSDQFEDVNDIPDGAKIALPNDASNQGRALMLLEDAGLIGLPEDFNSNGNLTQVTDNPKNLELVEMVPAQTPRALPDVAASLINNGIARDAGLTPLTDAIYHESETATPYINIIAANEEDKDNETYKRIAELYQEEDTAEFIKEEYDGNLIPTFVPLSNIGW